MAAEGNKPLKEISEPFKALTEMVNSKSMVLEVRPFSCTYFRVSVLFDCLRIAFNFAEMDYVAKQKRVRQAGNHSRNLLRVKQGINMVKEIFEQIQARVR